MMATNKKAGFTLIELLIVIAIIGILATVVLGSLNSARMKARDAQRIQDLHQMRNALMLYYDDHGHYPDSGNNCAYCAVSGTGWVVSVDQSWDYLRGELAPYMSTVPVDPVNRAVGPSPNVLPWNDPSNGVYAYYSDPYTNNEYALIAQLEDRNSKLINDIVHYKDNLGWGTYINGNYTMSDH